MLREYKQFLKKIHQIVHDQMKIGHVNCDTVSEALSMSLQPTIHGHNSALTYA